MQESNDIYYVVLVNGVPEAVTTLYERAEGYARELESRNRATTIVPTKPLREAGEFDSEGPTDPQLELPL